MNSSVHPGISDETHLKRLIFGWKRALTIGEKPSHRTGSGGKPADDQVTQLLKEAFGSNACPEGLKIAGVKDMGVSNVETSDEIYTCTIGGCTGDTSFETWELLEAHYKASHDPSVFLEENADHAQDTSNDIIGDQGNIVLERIIGIH